MESTRQHFFEHIIIQYIRRSTNELKSDFSYTYQIALGQTTRIIFGYLETLLSGIDTMINDVFPKKGRLFETDAIIKCIH